MIAEDLALLRDGLTRLLRDNGFDVVAAVQDGDALVHAVLLERPDVAIVDIRLPPTFRDGLATDHVTDAVLKSAQSKQWEKVAR